MQGHKKVKVPVILQLEALECGAAALAMIMAYYHKWVPLEEVRVACGVSRDGSNALNVVKAAKNYGLDYKSHWYNVEHLQKKATVPAILFWDQSHFVVLDGFKKDYVYINDPAQGDFKMPIEEFRRHYSGLCIEFSPNENFVADGKRKSSIDYLKASVKGNKGLIAFVMATCALVMIAGAFVPVLTRLYTDEILPGNLKSWYSGFVAFFIGLIVFQFIVASINTIYVKKSAGKIAVKSNAAFMDHLMRMPMEFFAQRMAGDLANRQAANDSVASVLIGQVAPILINLVMLVFYLVVMIQYSVLLTVVGIFTVFINLLVARRISAKRLEISRTQMRDKAKLDSMTVSGIDMIETIKASGTEKGFLEHWSGLHASMHKAIVRFNNVNKVLGSLPELLQQISGIVILVLGLYSIMDGHFTEGLLLAFQACMSSFTAPVTQLISAGQNLQEMRSSLERINDVMDYPEDSIIQEDPDEEDLEDARKLSGSIEMNHVDFGYSILGEPLLKDFNLKLTPGQRIAIVGGSGCGKSTVAKLLTGLYRPWNGEILYDGKPITELSKAVFRASVAMVDQDVVLFRDTVENNIKMWDKTIEDYDMILACRDAQIYDDIMHQKDGYQRVLEENGRNLSGGQRQRLEIARVLAGDPSIIILDEATSALDAITEYDVSNEIHNRGITSIIIAHRLSTIRDCDEIIVMDSGRIVEQGNHEELLRQDGLYKKLVTTQ